MEEEEVYMENDPLALYLKNENLNDFEIIQTKPNAELNFSLATRIENKSRHLDGGFKYYIEELLKSELLLEEDYHLLETYYLNIVYTTDKSLLKYALSGTIGLIGGAFYKLTNFKIRKAILPLCALPMCINFYCNIKSYIRNRKISTLLFELYKFKNLMKKSLQNVGELSATIGYYSASTINNLSLNNIYTHFAKEFYVLLLNAIKLLVHQSSQTISLVPLKVVNNMRFEIKRELLTKSDVTIADIKLLSEIYLLVQSDFIKTLGLSFCGYLWVSPNSDTEKIISNIIPTTITSIKDLFRVLNNEYTILRNYGLKEKTERIRAPQKKFLSPLHYLNSCLHNTELHFQQLLCKSRDLQSIIAEIKYIEDDQRTDVVAKMLDEMNKQATSSKNMIDTTIKCYNQLTKKDTNNEIQVSLKPITLDKIKTMETEQLEMKPEKLLYELYIPKEGLDLSELNIDQARPVFSMKELDYSGVLLEELKTILKTRNPEIYQEQMASKKPEINSDSEDDEQYFRSKRRDIFRPVQPVGLAENLQTISHVLNARKNLLQCEEICDDTFGGSDSEEVFS